MIQDIHLADKDTARQYKEYCISGNYQEALNILNNNPQLDSKIFDAESVNTIATVLREQEDNFFGNTADFMDALLVHFNELIQQLLNRGNWTATTEYSKFNFVVYNDLVYMYINDTPSAGNEPTDEEYWVEIGLEGEDGANGSDLTLRYQWTATDNYYTKDLVWYNGKGWVALQNNSGQVPATGSTYWQEFIRAKNASIEVFTEEQTTGYNGQIYVKIN